MEKNAKKTEVPNSTEMEIKIGEQIWMAKNLDVERFRNGDIILEAKTEEEWKKAGKSNKPSWCYYENEISNGKKFGKLYNWFAVNDDRGLAPVGWHIPNKEEWQKLIIHLGGEDVAGKSLKSESEWENDGNGNNQCKFGGLPGGSRRSDGKMSGSMSYYGFWWSSVLNKPGSAFYFKLSNSDDTSYIPVDDVKYGFSVRCIMD